MRSPTTSRTASVEGTPSDLPLCTRRYWMNAERDYQEFATYYSLPTVSFKAASYSLMKSGGRATEYVNSLFGKASAKHPTQAGHQLAKELVASLIQGC